MLAFEVLITYLEKVYIETEDNRRERILIPRAYNEVINNPRYGKLWKAVINKELDQLIKNYT